MSFTLTTLTASIKEWTEKDESTFVAEIPFFITNAEEGNYDAIDFLSNGFKIRGTSSAINSNGGTYIYMAFAESPFVTSTGVPNNAK